MNRTFLTSKGAQRHGTVERNRTVDAFQLGSREVIKRIATLPGHALRQCEIFLRALDSEKSALAFMHKPAVLKRHLRERPGLDRIRAVFSKNEKTFAVRGPSRFPNLGDIWRRGSSRRLGDY